MRTSKNYNLLTLIALIGYLIADYFGLKEIELIAAILAAIYALSSTYISGCEIIAEGKK